MRVLSCSARPWFGAVTCVSHCDARARARCRLPSNGSADLRSRPCAPRMRSGTPRASCWSTLHDKHATAPRRCACSSSGICLVKLRSEYRYVAAGASMASCKRAVLPSHGAISSSLLTGGHMTPRNPRLIQFQINHNISCFRVHARPFVFRASMVRRSDLCVSLRCARTRAVPFAV